MRFRRTMHSGREDVPHKDNGAGMGIVVSFSHAVSPGWQALRRCFELFPFFGRHRVVVTDEWIHRMNDQTFLKAASVYSWKVLRTIPNGWNTVDRQLGQAK